MTETVGSYGPLVTAVITREYIIFPNSFGSEAAVLLGSMLNEVLL